MPRATFSASSPLLCVLSCSVMSDSLWPHGLQPTRLLCPWDFQARIHARGEGEPVLGEKAGLKLNIQKMKIMASGPITSWQIDGETMETVRDLFS